MNFIGQSKSLYLKAIWHTGNFGTLPYDITCSDFKVAFRNIQIAIYMVLYNVAICMSFFNKYRACMATVLFQAGVQFHAFLSGSPIMCWSTVCSGNVYSHVSRSYMSWIMTWHTRGFYNNIFTGLCVRYKASQFYTLIQYSII